MFEWYNAIVLRQTKREVHCTESGVQESGAKEKEGSEDESLKTEDLAWARVLLPTTMHQGGRIGGSHGMQPGAWVFGFFLDGEDGPFVEDAIVGLEGVVHFVAGCGLVVRLVNQSK